MLGFFMVEKSQGEGKGKGKEVKTEGGRRKVHPKRERAFER